MFYSDFLNCTKCPHCKFTIADEKKNLIQKHDDEYILSIIKAVLDGNIELEELYKHKYICNLGEKYSYIYESLENAVQHTPGYLFKKGIDRKSWEKQYEYAVVLMDYNLFPKIHDESWFRLRTKILIEYSKNKTQDYMSITQAVLNEEENIN